MKVRLTVLLALVAAVVTALTIAPAAPAQTPLAAVNSVTSTVAGGGTFTGSITNLQFVNQNGTLAITGLLSGTLTNAAGTVIGTVTNVPINLPVGGAQAGGTCKILDLTLGPLDLNLLGLQVHLNQVHLVIEAQPGPGNLLGNLLCAVAHLLDQTGGGNLATLLNRLLGL